MQYRAVMAIEGSRYADEVVRLVDLFTVSDLLYGYEMKNCLIVGPAILFVQDGLWQDCIFEGHQLGMFWPLPSPEFALGAVCFRESSFIGCRFQGVGFTGSPSTLAQMKRGIGQ